MTWPRCPSCGGPARPQGPPEFYVIVEVVTVSEANRRDTWGKIKRKKEQREKTIAEVSAALGHGAALPPHGPWFLRLTRISPKSLDRAVNLPSALKAVEDAMAAVLGVDDGSPMLETSCDQQKGKPAVLVEVWGRPPGYVEERPV